MSALKDTHSTHTQKSGIQFTLKFWWFVNIQSQQILNKTVPVWFFFNIIFCKCFSHWTLLCVFFALFFYIFFSCAFAASNFNDFGGYELLNVECWGKNACNTIKKKKTTAAAAAASSFEPDFVFPLENVTVAQGRDGLYLNKSNKTQYFALRLTEQKKHSIQAQT